MKNSENTSRQLRVASLIQQSLANIFARKRGLDINLIKHSITITSVRVSADLRHASCYFLPFDTSLDIAKILTALDESKYAIRKQVTESIKLRYSPELRFYYDKGAENAFAVEETLCKLLDQPVF